MRISSEKKSRECLIEKSSGDFRLKFSELCKETYILRRQSTYVLFLFLIFRNVCPLKVYLRNRIQCYWCSGRGCGEKETQFVKKRIHVCVTPVQFPYNILRNNPSHPKTCKIYVLYS